MTQQELKQIFQNPYKRDEWIEVLKNTFLKVDLFTYPHGLFNEKGSVIQGSQIGHIQLSDNKNIAVFEVEVAGNINILRNRKGLRDIAAKYIDQGITHGALVFFYSKKQNEYRFTFISKHAEIDQDGSYQIIQTHPKRYTYILGSTYCGTAAQRVSALATKNRIKPLVIKDVDEAFSVEALTKEFYSELSSWYFWAKQNVKFPDDNEKEQDVCNATSTIRLITRLIFVWFLKQKGLIPDELFEKTNLDKMLNYSDKTGSTYYKAILQNLFFATLNTEIGCDKRKFIGRQYGVQGFYRYERFFNNKELFLDLTGNIPFLNGGLFENLDKNIGETDEKRIDCFSNKAANEARLSVPDILFFGGAEHANLNPAYDDNSHGNVKIRGLIDILKGYNFTIEENTPYEIEVALDPELLGKVFENLLASYNPETKTTARKQTGSFYTPREIVNYMVDESIIAYFKNILLEEAAGTAEIGNPQIDFFGNETRAGQLSLEQKVNTSNWIGKEIILEKSLRVLLEYSGNDNPFSAEDTQLLIKAIDNCKILDPACGSGAFPMGALQRLVHILQKLDKDNHYWLQLQEERAKNENTEKIQRENAELIKRIEKDKEHAAQISFDDLRKSLMKELDVRLNEIRKTFDVNANEPDYARKLFLIENCIFGVDIQPIAVQIAKLRFFISLIIDQKIDDTKPNRGILTLPNLETKFVAANTLIGLNDVNSVKPNSVYPLETRLKEVRHKHFSARTPETKKKYRELDGQLRNQIGQELLKAGFQPTSADQISYWNPYDQNATAKFFDKEWMFGILSGFNIVIGNPPYLRIQGVQEATPELIPYAKKKYVSAQKGNWDLYVLFTEAGYKMLKSKGMLAFIQPHKFFQGDFGIGIRNYISLEKCLYKIVHFGAEQMFDSATNYTCLFFLQRQIQKKFQYIKIDKPSEWLINTTKGSEYVLPQPENDQKWTFTSDEKQNILDILKRQKYTLSDVVRKIFQGIATSADKIYVLEIIEWKEKTVLLFSQSLGKEVEIERDFVKPFLMGKNVKRYEKPQPDNVVIFPYIINQGKAVLMSQEFIKTNYPLGWNYLIENRTDLRNREKGRMKHEKFYAYIYPKNLIEFETIKIITPDIANQGKFSIDKEFNYHTTTIYSFSFKTTGISEKSEYWLGLFNSKIMWFFLQATGNVLRGGFFRFKTEYLKPFPVKRIDFDNKREICFYEKIFENVIQILELKEKEKDTFRLEAEIDAIVFVLYGFTEEEMMKTLLQMPDVSERERREIQFNYKEFNHLEIAP